MKVLKKIFAAICSMTMVCSLLTVVQAADPIANPLSLNITDNKDNTVTIDVKTSDTLIDGGNVYIKIPEKLQPYITTWSTSTGIVSETLVFQYNTSEDGYQVGSNENFVPKNEYIYAGFTNTAQSGSFTVPDDGTIVSVKITLIDGGIPEGTLSEADRTLTLGCEYCGKTSTKRKGATAYGDAETATTYYFINTADETATIKEATSTPSSIIYYTPTAEGSFVVVPETKKEGLAFEEFIGTKEDGVTPDGSVAIATKTTFTAEDGVNEILWTVTPANSENKVRTHLSTIDVDGGAEYTLGMVINGLAAEWISAITAVLQ